MKYKRKLTANYYQGCSDRIARAIDRMAGLEPETATEQPNYRWRGDDRVINSKLDDHYYKMYEKKHGGN